MAEKQRPRDASIAKSWGPVNEIFRSESAEQRAQREGQQKVNRANQLREQARETMRGPGGKI